MTKLCSPLTLLVFSFGMAQSGGAPPSVPLELLERVVGESATLHVGELPADLPLELSLPAGFTVDLSVTRSWPGGAYHQLFLTAPSPAPEATAALARGLGEAGLSLFTPPEDAWGWWGFTDAAAPPVQGSLFCSEEASVEVSATPSAGATQLTLSVSARLRQVNSYGPCDEEAYDYGPAQRQPDLKLPPPDGATLLGTESGGVFSAATSSAAFEAGSALDFFADHYGGLLREAGWQEDSSGGDEVLSWSRWSKAGESWRLLLLFASDQVYPDQIVGTLVAVPLPAGSAR